MDVSESFALQPEPLQNGFSKPGPSRSSGLTLVLPPLRGGKPVIKVGKKSKHRFGPYGLQEEEKKTPRPVKLKPLKEVLSKLISQIKKKDDYAFFLRPVDTNQVPGYTDVVKRPMDLGTMSIKVDRGKYRSLEDFASDLRLVTSNAKAFNPPGSIYYTEAERIESWGLDHVTKAAATVIQYETDWNIEIEKDDEATSVNIDDDEDYTARTLMEADDPTNRRSPSVASQVQPGTSRRGVRGPYRKTTSTNKLAESIDADGRLPGSRDGLGAFPPGTHWAQTMLALKLKGKRYKTKKERLRVEKEGPPMLADGSLDYTEMEDPFSVLSVFAPKPRTRPYLTPLRPPLFTSPAPYDPSTSQSQSQPPPALTSFPTSINLPFNHHSLRLPVPTSTASSQDKRRHWTIVRNPTRSKQRDKEDEGEVPDAPGWQTPREMHAADLGSYAILAGAIEEEARKRKALGKEGEEEERVFHAIRDSVECESAISAAAPPETEKGETGFRINDYWSVQRAAVAEDYIRDIVYGGVDGLAYVRSLATFVTPDQEEGTVSPCQGTPLPVWVERTVVNPLTNGRHTLLSEAAIELARQTSRASAPPTLEARPERPLFSRVRNALYLYPAATLALAALLQIKTHKIDMGSLIKSSDELFQSEEEWAGKIFRERRKAQDIEGSVKVEELEHTNIKAKSEQEMEEPERTWMDVDASSKTANGQETDYELEGPEQLREVMEYVADVIVSLDKKIKEERSSASSGSVETKIRLPVPNVLLADAQVGEKNEDPVIRNLRLNLLALAKRAPLDTIARLPKDLVPEHIRHFVPTLSTPT